MLFRLKAEDFKASGQGGGDRPRPRVTLSDFSPLEWDVARLVAEDVAQGGRPPAGSGALADYCSTLRPPEPRPRAASGSAPKVAFGPRDWSKREGLAAVEFAMVAPIFIALLLAIVVYGGWFWLSQSVQSLAAESARVALGGLDEGEQRQLAEAFVLQNAGRAAALNPDLATVIVTHDDDALSVRIDYDVHDHPLILLAGPLPKPPSTIVRSAVVRTGGY